MKIDNDNVPTICDYCGYKTIYGYVAKKCQHCNKGIQIRLKD